MNHLKEWAKGKPLGLVMVAQQFAISAEACFEFLRLIKAGEKINVLPSIPKDKDWVSLYRNHRRIQRCVMDCLRRFEETGELIAEFSEIIFLGRKTMEQVFQDIKKRYKKMRPYQQRRFMSEVQKQVNRLYSLHLSDIESDLKGEVDENFGGKFKEALDGPEINFVLRGWMPCWFLYGEYPPRLLRRARLGDLSAMEKLLRLDTRVLNDTKIGEYFHQSKEEGKKATVDRLIEALRKGPKRRITIKRVKYNIAGLISLISIIFRHKLTEPQIKTLFDAIARDTGRDELIDNDLPESTQAFARAILRERKFWMPTMLRPRQKIV